MFALRSNARRALRSAGSLLLVLSGTGCGRTDVESARAETSAPRTVRMVAVETRPAQRFIEVTGTLFGQEELSISAEVSGRVIAIHADLGDAVTHGGALATIDPTDYELAVEEARAALRAALAKVGLDSLPEADIDLTALPLVARARAQESNALARLDRARQLFDRTPPLLSEQDFADIRTQHEVASTSAGVERLNALSLVADARVRDSGLRSAQQRLADTRVSAPAEQILNFRVVSRAVSVGEVVTEGQTLFRLVASDRVKFRGVVPERFAAQVVVGAEATLFLDAFPEPFQAAVSRVSPAVDIATRSFEIEIEAANPGGSLKPGSFVRTRIFTTTQAGARFIPETAVSQFAGVQRIYSVIDGKVVEHRVEAAPTEDGTRELTSAPANIAMVIDAPRALRDGMPVLVE